MTLTDPQGRALTPEDVAFFDGHPNLMRLAVKACRVEADTAIPFALKRRTYRLWTEELLDPDELRWQALARRNQAEQTKSRTDKSLTSQRKPIR